MSVNYPIQLFSSCLNGYLGYILYKLCKLNGINYLPLTFTHDAWNNELKFTDLFKFLELVGFVFKTLPYKMFGIPADVDYDLGLGFYSMGGTSYEFDRENKKIKFKTKVKYIDGNEEILDRFQKYIPGFKVIEVETSKKLAYELIDVMWGNSYASIMNQEIRTDTIKAECDLTFNPDELIIPENAWYL